MYVQAVSGMNMLTRSVLLSGTALPTLFTWNPETAQALPATSTFTRAFIKQVQTITTVAGGIWYQAAKSNEVPLDGLRRVENLLDSSNGTGPFTAVTKDGRLAVSVIASSGTLTITIGGTPQVFTPTGTPQRFIAFDDATGGSTTVAISGTATLSQPMAHLCQVGNDIPEPYIQHDAEFLNIGVNGVTYFNTANTSTVDGNGVVTEATGTTITGGGYLPEPAATNLNTESTDFSTTWTTGGLTDSDNGLDTIGLNSFTFTADAGGGVHRIFKNVNYGVSTTAHTAFCIAKAGTDNRIAMRNVIGGGTPNAWTVFNISTENIDSNANVDNSGFVDLTGGWYLVWHTYTMIVAGLQQTMLYMSDTDTAPSTSTNDISFVAAGTETLLMAHYQVEATAFYTSPIITSGSTVTRVADSLTDTTWPTEASAVVDTTVAQVIPGGVIGNQQNMLGFGDNSAHSFVISAASTARIFTGGLNSFIVAGDTYESERHSFGMSFKTNEGIVVDDEDNDNTDVSGTPSQGTIHIGSNSSQQTVPARYHQIKIFDQTLSVDDLKGQLP